MFVHPSYGCNMTFPFYPVKAMESQIGDFYKDVGELGSLQGLCLPQRGLMAGDKEVGEQSGEVETRIVRLIEPLKERRRILLASKEMHQVAQDLEDEIVSRPSPSSSFIYFVLNLNAAYKMCQYGCYNIITHNCFFTFRICRVNMSRLAIVVFGLRFGKRAF